METLFSKLTTQVYELEGLLLVIDKHGEDTPVVVYQRIAELGEQIAARTAQLQPQNEPATDDLPPIPAQAPIPISSESSETSELPTHSEPELSDEPEVPEQKQCDEPSQERENAPDMTEQNPLPAEDYDADETWQHENGEEFTEVFKVDYVEPTVRVDEKLQRSLSKDMHKALSLNDRFRFKRELFAGSEVELNQALDLVNAMQSFDEAQEYFIDDLGWDQDNEDVAEFMGLVRRHFL